MDEQIGYVSLADSPANKNFYKEAVGSLIYIVICTKQNHCFYCVSLFSEYGKANQIFIYFCQTCLPFYCWCPVYWICKSRGLSLQSQHCQVRWFRLHWMQNWQETDSWCYFFVLAGPFHGIHRAVFCYHVHCWGWILGHGFCWAGVPWDLGSFGLCHWKTGWEDQNLLQITGSKSFLWAWN